MGRLLLLITLLLVAACGGSNGEGPTDVAVPGDGDAAAGGGISRADNDLVITYDAGETSEPVTWHLTCVGFVEGDHPQAEEACAHLKTLEEPFTPVPADAVCTEQYGGPQTAHVEGLWKGEPVDLELSRVNGCYISQWDALVPLVPAAT